GAPFGDAVRLLALGWCGSGLSWGGGNSDNGIMLKRFIVVMVCFFSVHVAHAQISGMPRLPTGGGGGGASSGGGRGIGLQGSAGPGFVDFSVLSPKQDFRLDRGMYVSGAIERGFNVLHLYLTLGLSHMTADGTSNYRYTNLSTSTTYSVSDIRFRAAITDLSLGLKLKLIDGYWFRPYIEGGGLGGYHQITYTSKQSDLAAQGSDYKSKDVVMGSGYYGEAGIEAMFSDKFGVKISARQSHYSTKSLETLNSRPLRFTAETYYFALLFGF
ncbi:MAG: hypothetical protein NDI61_03215, partial [Bdellovibrionaceae bacterium]|nr:hypothetical protein [Pseudobdellovibrionaceae bacterium]